MSQSAYARRRGCSHVAVGKAIKTGRLVKSVNASGKIVDPVLADAEWTRNTNLNEAPIGVREREVERQAATAVSVTTPRSPASARPPARAQAQDDGTPPPTLPEVCPSPDELSLNDAARVQKFWQARLAELDYHREAGQLVPAQEVSDKLQDVFRTCRTKLLGVASRARQAMPHLARNDVAKFEELIIEALEALSAEGGES